MSLQSERQDAKDLCKAFFTNDDSTPFLLTDGQSDIFNTIFLRRDLRNQIMTTTQYGKSETVAMATILRAITFKEPWTILSGDTTKTDVIMKKVINHLFDNPALEAQIDPAGVSHMERLKHERSRERITFLHGGEIRTVGADARNKKRVKESLAGQGARNMIQDEAALIPDDLQAMVMRMLGGFTDSYLLKIGNPFYQNHFYDTWTKTDKYHKLKVDYRQAISEGRLTEDYIEEMRGYPLFKQLYEVEFPEDEILADGYQRLIQPEELEAAFVDNYEPEGPPTHLGADFAGGGNDRTAYTIRYGNEYMRLMGTNRIGNLMEQVPIVEDYLDNFGISPEAAGLDAGGLGQGITDRLHEKDRFVNAINFGQSPQDRERYKNKRAEMYYRFKEWIRQGGKIERNDDWYELLVVNYKTDSERKFQIQPKIELKKLLAEYSRSATSPDVADSGALTFGEGDTITEDDFEFV